jgi:hypothetical protein
VISHENWDYPNRGSSKYLITINCIHTTTHRAHIRFQMIILHRCNFANGYDINTLRMSSFYTTFCGQMKRVLCMTVCSMSTSHLWAWNNPHAIRECGYQVRFSVSVWAGIVGDIVMGPYLLPDRLTAR